MLKMDNLLSWYPFTR